MLSMVAFTLLVAIMIRPWSDTDKSWATHLNLTDEPYSNYTRSVQTFVSEEGSAPILVWRLEPCGGEGSDLSNGNAIDVDSSSCSEPGRFEYVAHGCVSCHGVDAKGGTVAPPLAGKAGNLVEFFARGGPRGMPAFSEEELTPEHLAQIIEYLGSLDPVVLPSPTPSPTPKAVSTQTPETTPTVPPAPGPTLSPTELEAAQQLFMNKGCGICHGAQAEGAIAPTLVGLSEDKVRTIVRDGDGGMPSFTEGGLSDEELGQMIAFLQTLE